MSFLMHLSPVPCVDSMVKIWEKYNVFHGKNSEQNQTLRFNAQDEQRYYQHGKV